MAANILKKRQHHLFLAPSCARCAIALQRKKLLAVRSCTPLNCKTRPVSNPSSFSPPGARLLTECLQHVNKWKLIRLCCTSVFNVFDDLQQSCFSIADRLPQLKSSDSSQFLKKLKKNLILLFLSPDLLEPLLNFPLSLFSFNILQGFFRVRQWLHFLIHRAHRGRVVP